MKCRENIRFEATARLAYNHCEMGRREIGRKIYETMPGMLDCRELATFPSIEENQQLQYARDVIKKGYKVISAGMYHLSNSNELSDEQELQVLIVIEQLDSIMYEGKYPDSTWHKANLYVHQSQVLIRLGRNSEAVNKLKEALKIAAKYDSQKQDIRIRTLLMGDCVLAEGLKIGSETYG